MSISSIVSKAYWLAAGRIQDFGPLTADLREPTQDRLGLYCLDFRPALRSGHFDAAYDDDGIPMRVLPDGSRHYSSSRVSGYAFACFQQLGGTGEDIWRERFLKQADWLLANADPHETGSLVWRYNFAHEELAPGWICAMDQGEAMSVLCRAYLLTGRQSYLDVATDAWQVLTVPVAEGGLEVHFSGTDDVCYEETPLSVPSRIFNGWIFTLWGLADLAEIAGCAEADRMYRQGVVSLQNHAADYDTGWWSTYDFPDGKPPRLASYHYHCVDTWMLEAMAKRTGIAEFSTQADRWERYAASYLCRIRALAGKLGQRLTHGY